jgi:hypothetical protein
MKRQSLSTIFEASCSLSLLVGGQPGQCTDDLQLFRVPGPEQPKLQEA